MTNTMTTILRIDSSVSGDASVTNRLNDVLVERISGVAHVVRRDTTQLPTLTGELFAAAGTAEADRSADQARVAAIADEILAEFENADVLVIATPIYNFGVPGGLKSWMDLITRAGRTFRFTEAGPEGLAGNKKVYITAASGNVPIGSEMDFATPHIRTLLEFLGVRDITVIGAGGVMVDAGSVDKAEASIRELAVTG